MSAVSGMTNLTSTQILQRDDLRHVCHNALDEALSIAHSQGVMLDRNEVVKGLDLMTVPGGTGDNKSSLCLDVLAKRPSEGRVYLWKTTGIGRSSRFGCSHSSCALWPGEGC